MGETGFHCCYSFFSMLSNSKSWARSQSNYCFKGRLLYLPFLSFFFLQWKTLRADIGPRFYVCRRGEGML